MTRTATPLSDRLGIPTDAVRSATPLSDRTEESTMQAATELLAHPMLDPSNDPHMAGVQVSPFWGYTDDHHSQDGDRVDAFIDFAGARGFRCDFTAPNTQAPYRFTMRHPDGSAVEYIEGDVREVTS